MRVATFEIDDGLSAGRLGAGKLGVVSFVCIVNAHLGPPCTSLVCSGLSRTSLIPSRASSLFIYPVAEWLSPVGKIVPLRPRRCWGSVEPVAWG